MEKRDLLRNAFLTLSAVALVVAVISCSSSESFSSLASIRVSDSSEFPLNYNPSSINDQPDASLFNPDNDPDGPGGESSSLQAKAEPMGVNDVQTALAGLESKDLSKPAIVHTDELASSAKSDDIFNPSHDPDAPKPKLSSLQRQELAETQQADKMKAQLKIEAQLAMLSEREKIHRDHTAVKSKFSKSSEASSKTSPVKQPAAAEVKTVAKPSLRSISQDVLDSLNKGFDPSKIITKELQFGMQADKLCEMMNLHRIIFSFQKHNLTLCFLAA